jgi:hypothetical protein
LLPQSAKRVNFRDEHAGKVTGMSKKSLAFVRGANTSSNNIDRRLASGWLRMSQLPIGGTLARSLIAAGFLDSIVVASPGSKRGVRLVSQESLDRHFRSLLPNRQEAAAAK